MSKYDEPVARGVALLDTEVHNWREAIDCGALDLGDCNRCVLGHVFGDYESGLAELGLSEEEAIEYGFDVGSARDHRSYSWLTKKWRKVLGCV